MKLLNPNTLFLALALLSVGVLTGCGSASDPGASQVAANSQDGPDEAGEADDHSGWWCIEHGIPEEECSMCSAKVADAFKAKGDWCEEHNRAESQCFKCDPTRAEKYTKLYEAKFGHEAPKPTK